ncbi:hypothetical protein KEM48_007495 [Puccinia striiformis f. sp. tritici PST-130]|nr:hypothetical protein KEM48_007495 [Puccinia striiformis f. sp. tritici PST-130]
MKTHLFAGRVSLLLGKSSQAHHVRYHLRLERWLSKAFAAINSTGIFAAWEVLPTTPPAGLYVDDIGEIKMPLSEEQIQHLIDKAHPTPSHGPVGKIWELSKDQLEFLNPEWQPYMLDISKLVATKLGIDGWIRSDFIKMVIYEKGAMLKPNTDTERTRGMFGTLIICLPSAHSGGEVLVLPVQSGYRCVLTYNLAVMPGGTQPTASALDLEKVPIQSALQHWLKDLADSNTADTPSHSYLGLDGEYKTKKATISFETLKARDFARAHALRGLSRELPFVTFLAVLEKQDYGQVHRERKPKWNDCDTDSDSEADHHDIADMDESTCIVKSLRALDGTVIANHCDFDTSFCLEKDPFKGVKIYEEEYSPDGGPDDTWVTHWYRRLALVIVPHQKLGEFLAECTFKPPKNEHSDPDSSRPDKNQACAYDLALSYLGKISLPSAQQSMLVAMSTIFVSNPNEKMKITQILKTALQYSHYILFRTVAISHDGRLPTTFFDWMKEAINALPEPDRTEKYQTWLPLLIEGYPSMAKRMKIIKQISSNPTDDDTVVADPAPLSIPKPCVQNLIHRSITSFLETTQAPTETDGDQIVHAIFKLKIRWPEKSTLLTSTIDRFARTKATPFLAAFLARLHTYASKAPPTSNQTMELHKTLTARVSNAKEDRQILSM